MFSCRSILNDYNELMNKQSMKSLVLLGSLLLATTAAKAESQYDQNSFWYGFTAGGASVLCQLAKDGMIPKDYAAGWMQEVLKAAKEDPDMFPFRRDLLNAFEGVKAESSDCARFFK